MKNISNREYWKELSRHKKRYLTQKQFPAFPRPYRDRIVPIKHTGYLMFIRSKFLFIGLIESLDKKNLYTAWSILKSYWENVAAFAYYSIEITELLKQGREEGAFALSEKMALGGRKFLTSEMLKRKGRMSEEYFLPSISAMLNKIDDDWKKNFGDSIGFKEFYNSIIAEGGHTTFLGLSISGKWLPDKSLLPDINKSWTADDRKSILNFTSMSSLVFFFYWDKFLKPK